CRIVALQNTLVVWIPPTSFFERNVAPTRTSITITVILGKIDAPTILRLPALWRRGFVIGFLRRNRNVDRDFQAWFDSHVLQRVSANQRKVTIVFVFVELRDVRGLECQSIGADRKSD